MKILARTPTFTLTLTLLGLAVGAFGALAAAGVYTEARRAPDQP